MSPPEDKDEIWLNACGIAVYGVIAVIICISLGTTVRRRRRQQRERAIAAASATASSSSAFLVQRLETPEEREAARISALWHVTVLLLAATRTALLGTRLAGAADAESAPALVYAAELLRRAGELLRFTAYALVVYWWAALYARATRLPRLRHASRILLTALTTAAFLLTCVFTALWLVLEHPFDDNNNENSNNNNEWEKSLLYELGKWTVVGMGGLLQVAVPLCAAGVCAAQSRAVWFARAGRRDVLVVAGVSGAYLLCGALHTAALLARTLLGRDVRAWVCFTAGYFAPEALETALGLRVLHARPPALAAAADSALLQQLYASAHGPLLSPPPPPTPTPPPAPVQPQQQQQQQQQQRRSSRHRRAASAASPATSLVHSLTPKRPHRSTAVSPTAVATSVNPGDRAWMMHVPSDTLAMSPSSAAAVASTKRRQHRSVYGVNVADPAAGSLFVVDTPAQPVPPLHSTPNISSSSQPPRTPPPRTELHKH